MWVEADSPPQLCIKRLYQIHLINTPNICYPQMKKIKRIEKFPT